MAANIRTRIPHIVGVSCCAAILAGAMGVTSAQAAPLTPKAVAIVAEDDGGKVNQANVNQGGGKANQANVNQGGGKTNQANVNQGGGKTNQANVNQG
ncbi:hypothetical protein, partial [Streptomyces sp. NPDC051219]|uniref:hypothetical protein n=1 Tax=Streptomyces sp. NPDC051219 TaxID=3155283 RepID=UPI0034399019